MMWKHHLRKDESITIEPPRILWAEAHEFVEQNMCSRRQSHWGTGMPGIGFEGGINLHSNAQSALGQWQRWLIASKAQGEVNCSFGGATRRQDPDGIDRELIILGVGHDCELDALKIVPAVLKRSGYSGEACEAGKVVVAAAAAAVVIVVVFQPRLPPFRGHAPWVCHEAWSTWPSWGWARRKWGRNYRRASVGFIFLLPVCLELRVYGRRRRTAQSNSAMAPRLKYSTAADSASRRCQPFCPLPQTVRHRTYRPSATPPHLLPTEVLTNLVRPGKERGGTRRLL